MREVLTWTRRNELFDRLCHHGNHSQPRPVRNWLSLVSRATDGEMGTSVLASPGSLALIIVLPLQQSLFQLKKENKKTWVPAYTHVHTGKGSQNLKMLVSRGAHPPSPKHYAKLSALEGHEMEVPANISSLQMGRLRQSPARVNTQK